MAEPLAQDQMSYPVRIVWVMTFARQELGRQGEELAARWYEQRGWVVLDQNWRSGYTVEIDELSMAGEGAEE